MKTLDDGKDRESMVKYAVVVLKMFKNVDKYEIVFMLSKQFPNCLQHTLSFIVDDAKYIIEKEARLAKK